MILKNINKINLYKSIILSCFLFFLFQLNTKAAVNCGSLTNNGTVTISWTDSYCFFGHPGNASNTSGAADNATYTNNGTISLRYRNVRAFYNGFDNAEMINNGTISSNAIHRYGYQSAFHDEGDDGESINNGTINLDYGVSGGNGNNGAFRMNVGSGQSFTNSNGASIIVIGANGNPGGLIQSDNTTVTNNGTFTIGGNGTTQKAIRYYDTADGQTLINTGTLTQSGSTDAILNEGTNAVITNTGTINGATYDINNTGTITTLTNDQGGSDSLKYNGVLPSNYKAKINTTSDFGKVTFSSESGSLTFGLDSNSSISKTTYSSVLQAISASNISNENTWINFNATYKYRIIENGSNWDLEVANNRTGYTSRITKPFLKDILTVLEAINTDGRKSDFTSALDNLSDIELERVARQIEGITIKKMVGQSFQKHSTFKRAVSSALTAPSVNTLTKNNYASLSLSDLDIFQKQNKSQMHSFNDFDFKAMAKIFKNKDLFSLKNKGSNFFIRTFADNLNQDKVDDDVGYEAKTAGFLLGNENDLTDKIQQGWVIGLSSSNTDFDDGFGNSDSETLHAMIYQNQEYDNYILGLNIGTFVTRADMKREITEGSVQSLKSRGHDFGFDVTADITQPYNLKNDFTFTPSFSVNFSYIIQDDLDETGGDLALSINNDDLLIVKPEIGFAIDKNFKNTEIKSESFGFSIYGSYEEKLDGTTSHAKIKDTGSSFKIVEDNVDDTFITVGLGYNLDNIKDGSKHNLGIYHTQNDDDNLNSSLLSYNYQKTF
ncbi:autotransporter domain-containing protein [Pelagibacteraceae bacterium]|nr:autotransporter domain-containing protein [Pelagibacteraceae bacterium]